MALTYTGADGLFTHLGAYIARINSYPTVASTLATDLGTLLTAVGTTRAPSEGLSTDYARMQGNVSGWRQTLGRYCDRRLTDPATVLTHLGLSAGGVAVVLPLLRRQMVVDGKTVKACAVTLGTVTAASGNAGTGTAYASAVLDGYNAPLLGAYPNVAYNGLASELAVPSETMTLECVADSEQDGLAEGQERFAWSGGPAYPDLDYRAEGSGPGPTLTLANAAGIVQNATFEGWAVANTPDSWAIDNGTVGTHIFQQTPAGANVFRGASSLKFLGTGAQATIGISQAVAPAQLTARRRYLLSLAIKASGVPAAGAITVQFTGTGYTAASGEKVSIAAGSFPTVWTLYNAWVNLPAVIPADWALSISIGSTLSNTVAVYFDSLAFAPAVYHGGVALGVVAGAGRWLKGDRLTFTVANNEAGKFSNFWRRHYKSQLPSVSDGSENISDSLVA